MRKATCERSLRAGASPRPAAARLSVLLVLAACGVCPALADGPAAVLWDGPKLTPTQREEVFEFAAVPTFGPAADAAGSRIPDRYELRFAVTGRCDVCIDILDASGKVIRHLAYGVLGPNAPAPFQPDRLDQSLVWDTKNDAGGYVRDVTGCSARVRLGLLTRWEKIMGWNPKNINVARNVIGISAGPEGVYTLTGGEAPQLRAFDHDGAYVRTIVPFRADKIDALMRADLGTVVKLPDGTMHYYPGSGPGEGGGVRCNFFGNHFVPPPTQRMAVSNGRIALAGGGGQLTPRKVIRLRTDGGVDAGHFYGCYMMAPGAGRASGGFTAIQGANAMAASPDGRWLYVSGLDGVFGRVSNTSLAVQKLGEIAGQSVYRDGEPMHSVYRIAWDKSEPGLGEPFLGEAHRAGADALHLNRPSDLATDADGNLYIADSGNDRIQVVSPEAKVVRAFPVKAPFGVGVDRRTGAVYALCVESKSRRAATTIWKMRVVKFTRDGRRAIDQPFEFDARFDQTPAFCVDGWAATPTVWLTRSPGAIALYADRGDRLEPVRDFMKEVSAAGDIPFYGTDSWRGYLAADPTRPALYLLSGGHGGRHGPWRFDVETGQYAFCSDFPITLGIDDIAFGPTGLFYARTTGYAVRLDPGHDWKEVPFDYGEPVGKVFTGGIQFPWPGGAHFQMGFGVSPTGEVLAMGFWGQMSIARLSSMARPELRTGGGSGNVLANEDTDWYQPTLYPGRPTARGNGNLVCVWDAKGRPKLFDAIKGVPYPSSGLRGDREGNIYLGYSGDKIGPDGKVIYGRTLVKFGPEGGRFFCDGQTKVAMKDLPRRPPEMIGNSCASGHLWTQGLLWSYGGINTIATRTCVCPNTRFDVDWYGRTFVPEAHRNTVAVLDTNGNFVMRIGRYGNCDSGVGPDSPIKVGGDEIAIAYCTYVASDAKGNWLYLNDRGNERIVRVQLDYHRQAVAGLGE